MSKRSFLRAAGAAAAGALLQACGGGGGSSGSSGGSGGPPAGSDTLLGLLQQDGNFSAMASAIDRAGLSSTLADASQNLTLFAADDDAFDRLGDRLGLGDRNDLLSNLSDTQWNGIVRYCLLPQRRSRSSLVAPAATLWEYLDHGFLELIFVNDNGQPTFVWDGIGRFSIAMTGAETSVSNGVLHITNDLLLPRGVLTVAQMLRASIDSYSTFASSMVSQGVVSQLSGTGPFTMFVPRDIYVPGTLSADQVRRHAMIAPEVDAPFQAQQPMTPLSGGRTITLFNGTNPNDPSNQAVIATLRYDSLVVANVIDVAFWASNGVIHTIDAVIPP